MPDEKGKSRESLVQFVFDKEGKPHLRVHRSIIDMIERGEVIDDHLGANSKFRLIPISPLPPLPPGDCFPLGDVDTECCCPIR